MIHELRRMLSTADYAIVDPGNAGAIPAAELGICNIVTAGAETRTLANPSRDGYCIFLNALTMVGACVVTVASAIDGAARTTITLTNAGDFCLLQARKFGTAYRWCVVAQSGTSELSGITATSAEINRLAAANQALATGPGTGITGGTGTVEKSAVMPVGTLKVTTIYIDLTGLQAIATDLDIIGDSTNPAYIGQVTTAKNGTLEAIRMTCLELPAGASADIDLYSAVEATGKKDDAVAGLTETALITAGGAWANGTVKGATAMPTAGDYLYLTNGAGANAGTYTAGKFLIEIYGY